jgi:hypothetical protein
LASPQEQEEESPLGSRFRGDAINIFEEWGNAGGWELPQEEQTGEQPPTQKQPDPEP